MLYRLTSDYLRQHLGVTLLVVSLQIAQSFVSLSLPTLTADIIDKGVIAADIGYIWRIGAVMIGLTLVQCL